MLYLFYNFKIKAGDFVQRYFAIKKEYDKFILDKKDIHHIKNVMRMNIGDTIEIVYEKKVYICSIVSLNEKNIELDVISKIDENRELSKHIAICFALSKEDKIDYILQKCTELGVDEFYPVEMNRCIVKISKDKINTKLDRWNKICKEAAEQSKRNIIPKVNSVVYIKDLINLNYDLKIICSINKSVTNLRQLIRSNNYKNILVVIGPEGDFSHEEEELLINNKFIPTTLGNTILRMETAPVFVASCINYENME